MHVMAERRVERQHGPTRTLIGQHPQVSQLIFGVTRPGDAQNRSSAAPGGFRCATELGWRDTCKLR